MKRITTFTVLSTLLLGLLCGCAPKESGEAVSVESVAMITGVGNTGVMDSFAGKVVSGETAKVKKDADKTVLEVYVEEGDMVQAGDILFAYDTEAMQLALDKLYLDKESYENTVAAAQNEIAELETQKAKANADQQLSYTLQIDARNADIREAQYNTALKEKEIETMEESMEKTEIPSPISGRIMSVGSADDSGDVTMGGDMGAGDTDAFITVMDVSAFRVEGRINELNRGSLMEGMPVIVRSRMDENQTWTGFIDSIDWDKPVSGGNNQMNGGGGDDMTTSSKYPFYVTLDSTDGLILGQHVYIEPDLGSSGEPAGLMLPSWYIVDESYVWAASGKDKLEKRSVTLGAYDPAMDEYEILDGLTPADYIAFPDDTLSEGMDVVYYDESSFGGDSGDPGGEDFDFPEDDAFFDGGVYSDDVPPMEGAVG